MLMTMAEMYKQECKLMPSPERMEKVILFKFFPEQSENYKLWLFIS